MAASVFMVHRILGGCTLAGSLREEDATLSSRLANSVCSHVRRLRSQYPHI